MAEIVNLRRARKAQKRSAEEKQAEANRTKHGVAKTVRSLADKNREKTERIVDQHKLDEE